MLNTVLILNNSNKPCGVQQWGERASKTLKKSKKYVFTYAEVRTDAEIQRIIRQVSPLIVLYNYHSETMKFLTRNTINKFRSCKHAAIIHEGYTHKNNYVGFDYFLYFNENIEIEPDIRSKVFIIKHRNLFTYTGEYPVNKIPTIGSFGFAFPNKGYEEIVKQVNKEFDTADIKFYMSKYPLADANDRMANDVIQKCKNNITKKGINLHINRDFLAEDAVLDALAKNDINCFFYPTSKVEGLCSSIDFALSVRRPIAITKIPLFLPLFSVVPNICIPDSSLKKIITKGVSQLEPIYREHTESNFIGEFETICDSMLWGKKKINALPIKYKEVVFYCYWHHGDLFFSREFIKTLMKIIPSEKFSYAHKNNQRTFADIPNLGFVPIDNKMGVSTDLLIDKDVLYINTHSRGKYLCCIDSLYGLYASILEKLGLGKLPGTIFDYIPNIDYTKFEISGVDEFVSKHTEDKILICNGPVLSGQMTNFSFIPAVTYLAKMYPQKTFIVTDNFKKKPNNVFFSGDITRTSDGFDMYEISYLSTFCRVLVGRYSGPHTCSQVKQNWMDPTKRLVTFTHGEGGNTVITNPNVKMKKFWSPHSTNGQVIATIKSAIES